MAKQKHTQKEDTQDSIETLMDIEECFIITPIGSLGSETFNKAMGLIDAVIDPVLAEIGMKAMPANRMQDLGSINKQLIKRVIEDRLVIANLTDLNPNVMYELAIRHGARKPVIIMAQQGTRLPFDINDQRTIFYSDTLSGVEIAKAELRKKIDFALKDENPDNPIYSYLESAKLFKEIGDSDPNKALLSMLVDIKESISRDKTSRGQSITSSGLFGVPQLPIAVEEFHDETLSDNKSTYIAGKLNVPYKSKIFQNLIKIVYSIVSTHTENHTGIASFPDGRFQLTVEGVSANTLEQIRTALKERGFISHLKFIQAEG